MTENPYQRVSYRHPSRRSIPRLSTGSVFSSQFIERRKRTSKLGSVDSLEPINAYPDEESMNKVLQEALRTETEFLEFAESLNLPKDDILSSTFEEDSPASILKEWRIKENAEKPIKDSKVRQTGESRNPSHEKVLVVRQNRSSQSQSPVCKTSRSNKVGLDHLDNLVRLMEELSALREQNIKLKQKVTDIESKKIHKERLVTSQCDRSFSSIGSMSIQNSPEIAVKTLNKIAMIQQEKDAEGLSLNLKRHSKSGPSGKRKVLKRSPRLEDQDDCRRESKPSLYLGHSFDSSSSKNKGSAWTKVKDAFKREVHDYSPLLTRSNISEKTPSVDDIILALDPSLVSDLSHLLPPISSSSSSAEEDSGFYLHNRILDLDNNISMQRSSSFSQVSELLPQLQLSSSPFRRHSITSLSIEDDFGHPIKEEKKIPKTTWGKVKNMIYTRRDSLKKKDSSLFSGNHHYTTSFNPNSVMNLDNKKSLQENRKRAASLNAPKSENTIEYELLDPSGIWMGPPDKQHPVDSPRLMPKHFPALTNLAADLKTRPAHDESGICQNETDTTKASRSSPHHQTISKKNSDYIGSPQVSRSSVTIKTNDNNNQNISWSNKVRKVWTSRKEDDFSSNPVSTPASPLQNSSTVFVYDENQMNNERKRFPPAKDSPESQSSGDWHQAQDEIQRNYELLQRRLSDEFNRKRQEWEKDHPQISRDNNLQAIGRSRSAQSGPAELERHLSPEFRRKYNEWQKMKQDNHAMTSSAPLPEAAAKTQETEKKVRARPLGEQIVQKEIDLKPEFKLKVAEWEIRKALAGQGCKNIEEIRKLMPEDFNRKLQKWELIKDHVGTKGLASQDRKGSISNSAEQAKKTSSAKQDDKRKTEKYPNNMDSVWIEQELKQIKREKQKLEIDTEKCLEKEARLEKIREALKRGVCHEKEITVKTAKGEEFKFCGISDTFTKRLFEWEESRGIGPESSTIALLNNPETHVEKDDSTPETLHVQKREGGSMKKARSEGSLPESVIDERLSLSNRSKRTSEGNISQTSPQSLSDQEVLPLCAKLLPELAAIADKDSSPPPNPQEHQNHSWDYLLHIEHLLDKLQHQICQSTEDKARFDCLVHDLRQTTHTAIKHQVSHHQLVSYLSHHKRENLSRLYSDLSCGEFSSRYVVDSDNDSHHSDASSSHSMSRYGSESPLYAIIMAETKDVVTNEDSNTLIDETDQHGDGVSYKTKATEDKGCKLSKPRSRRSSLSPDNTGKGFGLRMLAPKRRTSSENISTPNSGRSRSSSLLSSEYIPEEEDHPEVDEQDEHEVFLDNNLESKLVDSPPLLKDPNVPGPRPLPAALSTDMDQLYQLVHDLKEKDLSYHKSLIAAKNEAVKKAAAEKGLKTESTTSSSGEPSLSQDPNNATTALKVQQQEDAVSSSLHVFPTGTPISITDMNSPTDLQIIQPQGDGSSEWEPEESSERHLRETEAEENKNLDHQKPLSPKLIKSVIRVEKEKLHQTRSLPTGSSQMTIGFSGFHISPIPVRVSAPDNSELEDSSSETWETISKARSNQLMKAREQFFYGEICPKIEFQRVIVTAKEVSNVEEPQILQHTASTSDENMFSQSSHLNRLHKPNVVAATEGSPQTTGSVAYRRSMFEPKFSPGQKFEQKRGLDVTEVTASSISCPASPSITTKARKPAQFNFNAGH